MAVTKVRELSGSLSGGLHLARLDAICLNFEPLVLGHSALDTLKVDTV